MPWNGGRPPTAPDSSGRQSAASGSGDGDGWRCPSSASGRRRSSSTPDRERRGADDHPRVARDRQHGGMVHLDLLARPRLAAHHPGPHRRRTGTAPAVPHRNARLRCGRPRGSHGAERQRAHPGAAPPGDRGCHHPAGHPVDRQRHVRRQGSDYRVRPLVRAWGGAAIGLLHTLPGGTQIVQAASNAEGDATHAVAFSAAAFFLIGLLANLALPPSPAEGATEPNRLEPSGS